MPLESDEPVIISAILLSDHVIREAGTNKLSLIGAFSHWNCPVFPFSTPPFWITAFITNFRSPNILVNITVRVEDVGSGHTLASATGQIKFGPTPIPEGAMVEIPFRLNSMTLFHPGTYRAVLLTNDEKIGERHFTATALTIPGQQFPGQQLPDQQPPG
jgi:hypothetical protein